jgi:MFS family permease
VTSMSESPLQRSGNAGSAAPTLLLACAATLNGTTVSVALPSIGDELDLGPASLGWVVTAYFLVYGVAIPFHGRLADLYGIRRPFVVGLCIFAAGSVLCAAAPGYGALVGARAGCSCW